jgi:hypothetical protein
VTNRNGQFGAGVEVDVGVRAYELFIEELARQRAMEAIADPDQFIEDWGHRRPRLIPAERAAA